MSKVAVHHRNESYVQMYNEHYKCSTHTTESESNNKVFAQVIKIGQRCFDPDHENIDATGKMSTPDM